jgi:hypothetical protein
MTISKHVLLGLAAVLTAMLPSVTSVPTEVSASSSSTLTHRVVVFLQGINSTLTSTPTGSVEGTDGESPCPNHHPFSCIKKELSDNYGFTNADFLDFSYNGGTIDASNNWVPNDYRCNVPSHKSLETSAQTLGQMLLDYSTHHPGTRFVLIGHSLGGDVAFRYLADQVSLASPVPVPIDSVITLDSQLSGIPLNAFNTNIIPNCSTPDPQYASSPASGPAIDDLNVLYVESLLPFNQVAANNRQIVTDAHGYSIKVYTLGNALDSLLLPLEPQNVFAINSQIVDNADGLPLFTLTCSIIADFGCGHSVILWNTSNPNTG